VQLVSTISNLYDHNPPTSRKDGQTDDMRSQDRALHKSASRGKKERKEERKGKVQKVIKSLYFTNPNEPIQAKFGISWDGER